MAALQPNLEIAHELLPIHREDADRDRRVLERALGAGLRVVREPVTREFVRGLWLDVPAGSDARAWEFGR